MGVFAEYPILLRLACISICAEIAWATLLITLQYHFKDDLFREQVDAQQFIGSRVAAAALAFTACETIFKVPMGALSDRIGPRPLILFALITAAISPLFMYHITDAAHWWYFIPLRGLDGMAAAALWPSMSAIMARSVPRTAKAAAMSVFNGAYCMGLAVGPMLGLSLAHFINRHYNVPGNRYVFPLCSVVMIGGLLIALNVLRHGVGRKPTAAEHTMHIGEDFPSHQAPLLRGRPLLIRMMVLYALSQSAVGMLYVVPLYLHQQFHIEEGDLPRLIAGPALFVALIAIPLGRLADHIGRPRAVWISYVMASGGMLLVSLSSLPKPGIVDPRIMTLALGLFGIGMLLLAASYILGTPAWLGLTSVQVPDGQQAHALSLMQTAQGVGVNIGLGLVASGGYLLTEWHKVQTGVSTVTIFVHNHLKKIHVPVYAPKLRDAVPINYWLFAATLVFLLCLIGTFLFVHEPEHPTQLDDEAARAKQPLEISGI